MATVPRTYKITSSAELDSIAKVSGQVIALWDVDAVYYDAPVDEGHTEVAVRRKISGVKVINSLKPFIAIAGGDPEDPSYEALVPMNEIIYVYIPTNPDEQEYLPSTDPAQPLYDLRVWIGDSETGKWEIVGTNRDDINVKTEVTDTSGEFYLTGSATSAEDVGVLLKTPKIYAKVVDDKGIIHADTFDGTVAEAGHADRANIATIAIKDETTPGNNLTDYIFNVTGTDVQAPDSGTKLTFTSGTGAIKRVINTKDTTYTVFGSAVDGLVPKTNTVELQDTTHLLLTGSGWVDMDNVTIPKAESANRDGTLPTGQIINQTYVKNAAFDPDTRNLTFIYGDNHTGGGSDPNNPGIIIPDTQYSRFNVNVDGLVPGPASSDSTKFLRSDARWEAIPTFAGSNAGLVPTATPATDAEKYLKGNGTWGGVFAGSGTPAGLVPSVPSGSDSKFLRGDGTWADGADTQNTAGSNQDVAQLYVIGAKSQTVGANGVQTFSNSNVFINNGKLYQADDSATPVPTQVVDLTSTQALENKTYEGYTLDSACSYDTADSIYPLSSDTFTGDGTKTDFVLIGNVQQITSVTINETEVPDTDYTLIPVDTYSDGATYVVGDYCTYNDALYRCSTAIPVAEDWDASHWTVVSQNPQADNLIRFNTAPASSAEVVVDYLIYRSGVLPTTDAVVSFVENQIADIENIADNKIDTSVLAPTYDETATYNVGDFCMYENTGDANIKLYRCKTAITTPEDFHSNKWESMTIIEAIKWIIANPNP